MTIPIQERSFAALPDLIAEHANERGAKPALIQGDVVLTYEALDLMMNRVAAALATHGIARHGLVAIVSPNSLASAMVMLGALRAGCVPVPIAPSSTPAQIAAMVADSAVRVVFADSTSTKLLELSAPVVDLGAFEAFLPTSADAPTGVVTGPDDAFNVIYSSGTTGAPKGVIQTHAMRWSQIVGLAVAQFDQAVTMVATPLYSNTTLVSFLPTLAYGGTVVLMERFDARSFLETAARWRATHAMLVPVQYQRIMALPDFDAFDLSSFQFKTCTSAPFSAELKADVLQRWPGPLIEIYGMTEGGGACLLFANQHPDKLHTVGRPAEGNDIRLIDEAGQEVALGEIGEVVGRSSQMMAGYHGRPDATREIEWISNDGQRFIRHGDLGRFDEDGFLILLGRSKDMIISGGFNIYPGDLEAVLLGHPKVADAAVIGVPSTAWGETPFAFYVPRDGGVAPDALVAWANARLGKTQRLAGARPIGELPRNAIGKVLKRDLRDLHAKAPD